MASQKTPIFGHTVAQIIIKILIQVSFEIILKNVQNFQGKNLKIFVIYQNNLHGCQNGCTTRLLSLYQHFNRKALACIQGQLQRLANFCELGQVQKSNIRINNNFTF